MSEIAAVKVWTEYEAVLIYLIRIVGDEADPSCEGILCDNISLNKLRLYLLKIIFDTLHHLHYFSLKFSGSWGCWLEFWSKWYLIVLKSGKISRLIHFWHGSLLDLLQFLNWNLCCIWRNLRRLWWSKGGINEIVDFLLTDSPMWIWDGFHLRLLLLKEEHHH